MFHFQLTTSIPFFLATTEPFCSIPSLFRLLFDYNPSRFGYDQAKCSIRRGSFSGYVLFGSIPLPFMALRYIAATFVLVVSLTVLLTVLLTVSVDCFCWLFLLTVSFCCSPRQARLERYARKPSRRNASECNLLCAIELSLDLSVSSDCYHVDF